MRIDQNRHFRLAEHIDKPGRNGQAVRIDYLPGLDNSQGADADDATRPDSDVTGIPR